MGVCGGCGAVAGGNSGLPIGPGESVVPTVEVQNFHYSALQLMVVSALVAAAILGILWWGTRPPKVKRPA